eukprot:3922623-Karenia_brevis.AAC.1
MLPFTNDQAKYLSQYWTLANRDDENTIIQEHQEIICFASPTLLHEFVGGHKPFLHVMDTLFADVTWSLPYCQDTIDTNLADEDGAAEM